MLGKIDRRLLLGVIIVLLSVIVYLLFFQENPCDTLARLTVQAQEEGGLSPEIREKFLAASYKCE